MYIMVHELISTEYLKNSFHQSVSPIVARQRLGKNVIAATKAHEIEEFFATPFSMRSVSYQGKEAISSSQNFLLCGATDS
jgi:hypothetical protein